MSMAITFVVSMMAILTVTFTIGQDMMEAVTDFSWTWIRQERRLEAESNTRLSSPLVQLWASLQPSVSLW